MSQVERMGRWTNRVALVTGASAGIGAVIAKDLVQFGMTVIGAARNITEIEKARKEYVDLKYPGKLIPRQCDISKEKDIEEMFDWIEKNHGGVDVCVNNAGVAGKQSLLEINAEQMRGMLDLNVIGLVLCASKAIKSMRSRGVNDGHIFLINSMLGHRITGNFNFYASTKWAVTALTEGFRRELVAANSRIRVTSISPAVVETEFALRALGPEIGQKFYQSRANTVLHPQDVSDSLIFALSAPENAQVHDVLLKPTQEPLS